MEDMDIDSPRKSICIKPRNRIVRRLAILGVPEELLSHLQPGFVAFVKDNKSRIPEFVATILPSDEEVAEFSQEAKAGSKKTSTGLSMQNLYSESMIWVQWLMFEGEPTSALKNLSEMSVGQRGVCGSVWGHNDIAYRCRTCEHDPTCAICVPCFRNGNHRDHDYSIIYTGGGCCDCGDVTAWKREGFCLEHKGAEQIQPLSEEYANSVGPVLDAMFVCWKNKLQFADSVHLKNPRASDRAAKCKKVANELTFAVVEMLLQFCKLSESLLSFVSKMLISSAGILEILVRAERFLCDFVVKEVHELLLKLLGEPMFKYEFAKVFLSYYPVVVNEAIEELKDNALKKYPLLSTFSVQIYTVPTLTPRLVKEMNLLAMLLGCLQDIFVSCAGENGRLQVTKWGNLYETTIRVVEDIRFVMSHAVVPRYVIHDQPTFSRNWLELLALVQGMNPLKRETGLHIEEENEYIHLPFGLGHSIANIHSLLVDGAFSVASSDETDDETSFTTYKQSTDDIDSIRHAKVGRLSQESSACNVLGKSSIFGSDTISPSAMWLTHECLRAIEKWLQVDNTSGTPFSLSCNTGDNSGRNFVALKKILSKTRKGKFIFGRLSSSSEEQTGKFSSQIDSGFRMSIDHENDRSTGQDSTAVVAGETNSVNVCNFSSVGDSMLEGDRAMDSDVLHILSLSDWPNIDYDVSSQDISVHIPLHWLLSLLLQKALRKCFGEPALPNTASSSSSNLLSAMCTDFFAHFLMGCHPHGFSAFVMEHPLRIRVFCAQVHAGMWRKNGDAALFSCELYRSVRWSERCLELDLFLLQCCGALAPADLFVNRILERFGLSDYLSLNVERSSKYEPVQVREMLTLIIQIVKERRFCGLTVNESLKRELIYKLAIGDTTHSQLVKSLPRDLSKCSQLQEILETIAVYSQPSGFKQGMYSLQWAYWRELDLYHPRWSSRDLQVAEERYMRFCNVSALTTQLPKWTKIYPPLKGLGRVATCKAVLQIVRAVLFYAVFAYESTETRAPDSVLLTALHLLALSLDICYQEKESTVQSLECGEQIPLLAFAGEQVAEGLTYGDDGQCLLSLLVVLMRMHKAENPENLLEAGNYNLSSLVESLLKKFAEIDSHCMAKLQQIAPEITCHLTKSAQNSGTNSSRPTSDGEKRRAKAREKQAAILEKMRAEQSKFMASIDSSADDDSDSGQQSDTPDVRDNTEEAAQVVCSLCHDSSSNNPMSFLILLQKSRLLSFIDRGPLSWEQPCSTKEHVSTTSKMVMDHSGASTSSSGLGVFSSSQLVKMVQDAIRECSTRGQPGDGNAFLESLKAWFPSLRNIQMPSTSSAREERTLHAREKLEEDMYLSICKGMREMLQSHKDNTILTAETGLKRIEDTQSALLVKYIAALSREVTKNPSTSENAHNDNMLVESYQPPAYDGLSPPDCDGVHISSCGHAVHQGCLDRYLSSLKERFVRRIVFEGGHIVDPEQGEFLCPVCRGLANSVLPALPGESQKIRNHSMSSTFCSAHASSPLDKSSEDINSIFVQKALALLQSAANVVEKGEILNSFPLHKHGKKNINPEPISRALSKMYFPGKHDKLLGSARFSPSMLMWDTIKYSLISMEIAARCSRNSMTPTIGLDSLYKELESSSGFILSLLLKAVQSKRSKDSLHVLQRFRGIQSFTDSICLGISRDHAGDTCEEGDKIICILKHLDMESSFPDIQFWSRASDPVLGRDPFSSLMWVLFCLPYPFLSCEESFISFVNIFYIVSVAQAIITYCGKYQCDKSETGFADCLISDIFKAMRELGSTREYFVSNHIEPSSNITQMIHSLSFPYLRRCALLWKLLNSSAQSPFFDGDNMFERPLAASHIMDTSAVELNEVDKLEKMFQIPSLDNLLKDSGVRSLVSKWFCHFSKEFEVNGFRGLVHCTPAVPFHLMHLPRVYHDLLQRYMKQTCVDCESVIDDPALCLLCGRLCSSSWKPCCRENGCQAHAVGCGAGTGIFLLIKRTTILLQRCARQAPWPSPYLDAFGEEDIEMRRGKPLYLNEERYAALTYMVSCHGLDRNSKVLGQTTIGSFFMI